MASVERAETTFNLILLAAIFAVVAYAIYKFSQFAKGVDPNDPEQDNQSIINKANAALAGHSSEGYTQALSQTLSHPITTMESILGIGDDTPAIVDSSDLSHETSQIQGSNLVAGDGGGE